MAKTRGIYKCSICGNIVEVLFAGAGQLICCGQPMDLLDEKIADEGKEKHVPVIEKTTDGCLIKIGSIPHPMEDAHYIQWIEAETEKGVCKKFLKSGEPAEMKVCGEVKSARTYCNVHGLWKS
ncbi:MAG: desulfoferrodoxin [Patescibacteria group bacterium]|jgi:superoxide reductase